VLIFDVSGLVLKTIENQQIGLFEADSILDQIVMNERKSTKEFGL